MTMDGSTVLDSPIFCKDKVNELSQLLHECVDEICKCNGAKFSQYTTLDWTKEEFVKVQRFFFTLLHNPSCLHTEVEKMPIEFHGLPEHVQKALFTCLKVRKGQLVDALISKYSCKHLPTLVDFDWRLKYIMGSSKMASVKEPLLQIDLIFEEKEKEQILGLELNKEELDLLITTLEANVT